MSAESQGEHLFLYGSLLTGTPNRRLNKLLKRPLRHARPAVIRARLYHLGHYPGAVGSALKADCVYGRLLRIRNPRLLQLLDRYEDCCAGDPSGGEFVRTSIQAQLLPSRKHVRCWVYFYNRDIAGKRRIVSGDHVDYMARRRKKWRAAQPIKANAIRSLFLEHGHAFHMRGVRKHIHHPRARQAIIMAMRQLRGIAGEGRGIAGHIDDARRIQ